MGFIHEGKCKDFGMTQLIFMPTTRKVLEYLHRQGVVALLEQLSVKVAVLR